MLPTRPRSTARRLAFLLITLLAWGCQEPPQTSPIGTGSLTLSVTEVSALAAVEGWRVTLSGPSGTQTRNGAPGSTIEFSGLTPGGYTVQLEGLRGQFVTQRGQTSVTVLAGATATAVVTVTAVPGALAVVSGNQQLGWNSETLQLPIVVRLTDPSGGGIDGVSLTVTPTSGGGSVASSSSLITDAAGQVSILYRLGGTLGTQGFRVDASVGGTALSTSVSLVAVEPRRQQAVGGANFSCAIVSAATQCWGANSTGGLGNRVTDVLRDTVFAVRVGQDPGFVALTANEANNIYTGNACGLTANGAVYCWGLSPSSSLGVTPTDTCQPSGGPLLPCFREPRLIPGNITFRVIDAGGSGLEDGGTGSNRLPERLCGISSTGDAYCWGENRDGGIGDSTRVSKSVPTRVAGGRKWIDISTGTYHTCGITVLGEALCWGTNSSGSQVYGGLGTGDSTSSTFPRPVSSSERFRAIATGTRATCALTLAGAVQCWSLDQGTTTGGSGGFGNSLAPVAPAGNYPSFVRLSVGLAHACAVTDTGIAYCWGRNRSGNLGDGSPTSTTPSFTNIPVRVRTTVPFREVNAGVLQTCAVNTSGTAYCWGRGAFGQLGNGTRIDGAVPSRVTSSPVAAGVAATVLPAVPLQQYSLPGRTCPGTLSAQVVDADGYPVAGVAVEFSSRTTGATVSSSSATTNAQGTASVGCTVSTAAGANTFAARVASLAGQEVVLTVVGQLAGPPATITCRDCFRDVTVGKVTALGAQGWARVEVYDAFGLPVSGFAVTISRAPGSRWTYAPTLPATLTTDSSGAVSLTSVLPDTIVGRDSLFFSWPGLQGAPPRMRFTSTADVPVAARFVTPPANTRVGQPITPAVAVGVIDRYGNLVTTSSRQVTVALVGSGATLGGTTAIFTTNGVSSFNNLTVSAVGTYQLTATASSLPPITSAPFGITTTQPASGSVFFTQSVSGALALGATFQYLAQAVDANNVPLVPQPTFTWTTSNSGIATVSATGLVTAVSTGTVFITATASTGQLGSTTLTTSLVATNLTVGGTHACGKVPAGRWFCWGNNSDEQLGATTPSIISTRPVGSIIAVSGQLVAGRGHSCLPVTTSIYCWGINENGQVGGGIGADVPIPRLVNTSVLITQGLVPINVQWIGAALGAGHTCALASTQQAFCWGDTRWGALGNGSFAVVTEANPVRVLQPPGVLFTQIVGSFLYTCGLTPTGTVYCWGYNARGELGTGNFISQNVPTPVLMPPGVTFVALAAGNETTCGRTAAGAVYCWGENTYGQLGNGASGTDAVSPVLVQAPAGVTFTQIAVGASACGITAQGAAYCWGRNTEGQVGNGTASTAPVTRPTLVQAPSGVAFAGIAAGYTSTCGWTANGEVYCWGLNSTGQLGDGTTTNRSVPTRIQ